MFESVPFKGESVKMKRKRLAKFFGCCGASWVSALTPSSVDSSAISATADEEEEQSMFESELLQGVSRKRKLKRPAKFLDWWVVSWALARPYSSADFCAINTIRNRDDKEEFPAVSESESVLCKVASTKRKRRRLVKSLARWMLYHWLWRKRVRSIRGVCRKGFYWRILKKLI